MNKNAIINPFERTYHEQEVNALSLQPKTYKNIELKIETASGRVDGFMYKDFLVGFKNCPILFIDGKLWMSLTPMEIESHFMPISLAKGHVGVGGLGLGYYTQRILAKDEVESVTVYEFDQNVIDFYYENFGDHEKLTIIKQDVRTLKNEVFDFFYNDIYPAQMDEQALQDMRLLTDNNHIGMYHFWTFEAFLLEIIQAGYADDLPMDWLHTYAPFLEQLFETKGNLLNLCGRGDEYYELFAEHRLL